MSRTLLAALTALALAPAGARAADYDLPLEPCSQVIGVVGVEQGGLYQTSALCSGSDYVYEVVAPPEHGTVAYTRRPFQNGPVVDWFYDTLYVPDAGLPVGATDEWSWRVRAGDRLSAVRSTKVRIIARANFTPAPPAATPLTMTVAVGSRRRRAVRRRGLALRIGCDTACTTTAALTYRGKPAGSATATAAGPLVVRLTGAARRARHPALRVQVTGRAASGALATARLAVRLRGS